MLAAILDHLWQSTLLAIGVGTLALAFRRTRASVRYGLWLSASLMFLVPFGVLGALGRLLAGAIRSPVEATPEAVFIAQAAQPFSQAHAAAPAIHAAPGVDPAPIVLAIWALGSLAVLLNWAIRWTKVRTVVRASRPLGWSAPMPILASSSLMEPGLVGLWRPVLVIPESLPDHLTQPQIDALVAHEACHFRRRDNLTAAVHMLVEALFWFHPMVWWIGTRLLTERERACDEAVVRSGHDRAAYARGLVECCRLYLQSHLACVAGACDFDLKTRVRMIMTAPPSAPLSGFGKALLLVAGTCALATPVAAGWLVSPSAHQAAARLASAVSALASTPAPAVPAEASPQAVSAPTSKPVRLQRIHAAPTTDSAVVQADAAAAPPTAQAPIQLAMATAPARLQSAPAILPTSAAEPPRVEVSPAPAAAQDADKPICRTEATTGTRFVTRYCLTEAQWKQQDQRLHDLAREWSLDSSRSPATPSLATIAATSR
jgi:beta-lactamase regulating signal transducer with metallopeptidase domain